MTTNFIKKSTQILQNCQYPNLRKPFGTTKKTHQNVKVVKTVIEVIKKMHFYQSIYVPFCIISSDTLVSLKHSDSTCQVKRHVHEYNLDG